MKNLTDRETEEITTNTPKFESKKEQGFTASTVPAPPSHPCTPPTPPQAPLSSWLILFV